MLQVDLVVVSVPSADVTICLTELGHKDELESTLQSVRPAIDMMQSIQGSFVPVVALSILIHTLVCC
jgi:hypothetical protein